MSRTPTQILDDCCTKLNAKGHAQISDLLQQVKAQLAAERDGLRKALELIASHKGKTIFSLEPGYRQGAHDAYEQLADTALAALAPQHASDCATNNAPALPNGPCDCSATATLPIADQRGAR